MKSEVKNPWINHYTQVEAAGCQGKSRPQKIWKDSVEEDHRLSSIDPNMIHERIKLKNAFMAAMKRPTLGNRGKVAQNGQPSKQVTVQKKADKFCKLKSVVVFQ